MISGVAVGAGLQSIVACVNVASYYLVGIPIGVVLGYTMNLQVKVSYPIASLLIFMLDLLLESSIYSLGS